MQRHLDAGVTTRKLQRNELMDMVINEAGLPAGANTDGYFTREQMIELLVRLRAYRHEINRVRGLVKMVGRGEGKNVNE